VFLFDLDSQDNHETLDRGGIIPYQERLAIPNRSITALFKLPTN